MRTQPGVVRSVLAALVPLTLLIVAATTLLGPQWIGPGEILAGEPAAHVFWRLRVPRSLLAAVVGAGLSIGGVIFQTLFRNPLATPYTLGVAGGASLAAGVGFLSGWQGARLGGVPPLTLLAFGGAMATLGLVFAISRLRRGRDLTRLLLAGVCVAYMCSAGILLVTFLAEDAITNDIVVWMMGSLGVLRPRAVLEVTLVLVPVMVVAAYQHRALDLLNFGDQLAASRGVNVDATLWGCFALVGLLVAVIVANCGPIGFVGLMVPHIGRALFGVRTLPLLVGSALLGAAFLAVCDGLARSLPVRELPVGVVTNVVGAIFFFVLLAMRDFVHGAARS